jgi:hypothetical protein
MTGTSPGTPGRWLAVLVVLAVIAGVVAGLWLFSTLT